MSVNTNYARYSGYDSAYPSYRNQQQNPQNPGLQTWSDFRTSPSEISNVVRSQAELIQAMKFVLSIVLKALNSGDMSQLSGMAQKFLGGLDSMAPPFPGDPQTAIPGHNFQSPNQGAPNQGVPNQGVPNYGAPNYGAPNYGAPPNYGAQPNYGTPPPSDPYANPQGGMPFFDMSNFNMPNFGMPGFNTNYNGMRPPQQMNDDRALSTVYNAFDSLKTPGAEHLTKADLERAAQNPNLHPEIRSSAQYMLDNPGLLRSMDTAHQDNAGQPGPVDGIYARSDLLVTMDRDKLTGGDRAALQTVKNNARELFAGGKTMNREDLQRIADTGEISPGKPASTELRAAAGRLAGNRDLMDRLDSANSLYGGSSGPNLNGSFGEADIDRLLRSPLSSSSTAHPDSPKSPRQAVGIVMTNFKTLFPDGVMTPGKIEEKLKDTNVPEPQRAALQMLLDTPGLLDKLDKGRGTTADGQIQMAGLTNYLGNTVASEPEKTNLQSLTKHWNSVVGEGQNFDATKIGEYIAKADKAGNKEAADSLRFLEKNPALMDALDVNLSHGKGHNPHSDVADKKFNVEQVQQLLNAQ